MYFRSDRNKKSTTFGRTMTSHTYTNFLAISMIVYDYRCVHRTAGMAQWSSYQLHTLMDLSSGLAPGPSLLVWVERWSNRTMWGLNGQSLEISLHQVHHKTYLCVHRDLYFMIWCRTETESYNIRTSGGCVRAVVLYHFLKHSKKYALW